jgi:hypothetical protein
MFQLNDDQVDRIISRAGVYFLGGLGFVLLAATLPPNFTFGLFLGLAMMNLAFYSALLAKLKWRAEPGLWMLGIFLTAVYGTIYGFYAYEYYEPLLAPQPANRFAKFQWGDILSLVEIGLALTVLWQQVRLTFSIAIFNWQWTKTPKKTRETKRSE